MSEYVPTTEVVKDSACWQRKRLGEPRGVDPEAFDRWLTQIKAEAAVTVLREVVDYLQSVASDLLTHQQLAHRSEGHAASVAVRVCADFVNNETDRIARETGGEQEDEG